MNVNWYRGDGTLKGWIYANFDFDGWWVPVLFVILTLVIGVPLLSFLVLVMVANGG